MDQSLSISCTLSKTINFAMQQNYVPLIRSLSVKNNTTKSISNVLLKISFEPEFAREYIYNIDEIASEESVEITPVKIHINTEYLFKLTEKMIGTITITACVDNEIIYTQDNDIELLAFDEWSGLSVMPEIIAAFLTPNHPSVTDVISLASNYLNKWSKDPSFTGYQTKNSNKVKLQMAAIYSVLQEKNIVYNNPPASYEKIGQRVRLAHDVLAQKQGTCLDLAVLYASCLEAVGLFPLIVFIIGHAFVGCWLDEQTFADCFIDDVSAIEKRIADNAEEMLLVECTDYVSGSKADFDHAVKHGMAHINNPENFICAVDIKRTRGSGIRPIPLQLKNRNTIVGDIDETIGSIKPSNAPSELNNHLAGKTAIGEDRPITRQKIWERKLLNLSLRNSLLNFRPTKGSFQIMTHDIGKLEDHLADGKELKLMEVPSEWVISLRDPKLFEIENDVDLINTISESEFSSGRVRTFLKEDDFKKTVEGLRRAAVTSLEENGANTLFLALGFLRWYETKLSEKPRYAPIVMVPIELVRSTKTKGYILRSRQEETRINITLLEYLRQDHDINIKGLDPLPEDDHGVDIPLIMNTMREAVKMKTGWNVLSLAFVGLFSFGQFVMWSDITNRADDLAQNKVVSSLINGQLMWNPIDESVFTNSDDVNSLLNMAVPVDVDSSQLRAIKAAAAGQSFVLHGPPGTGKSQTITNMIANALYQGKSVLFVAEKMAALNVVQKRLCDIGLDPFCLELHSNKTNKSYVLKELNKALNVGRIHSSSEYAETANTIMSVRRKLNGIVEAVHEKRSFGCSLYDAISLYEEYSMYKGNINFDREMLSGIENDRIRKWDELVRKYAVICEEVGDISTHPLKKFRGREYTIEIRENLVRKISSIISAYPETSDSIDVIYNIVGESLPRNYYNTIAAVSLIRIACSQGAIFTSILDSQNFDQIYALTDQISLCGFEYETLYSELSVIFDSRVFDYDAFSASQQWNNASSSWFISRQLKQNKLLKELRVYSKQPDKVTKDNILTLYEKLIQLREKKNKIVSFPTEISSQLSGVFIGISTNWNDLRLSFEKTAALRKHYSSYPQFSRNIAELPNNIIQHINVVQSYVRSLDEIVEEYSIDLSEEKNSSDCFGNSVAVLKYILENIDKMRYMTSFNDIECKINEEGLVNISQAFREGSVNSENMQKSYVCGLNYALILLAISQDERLSSFRGKVYDYIIVQYREIVEKFKQLTIQELIAKLSANTPNPGITNAASSEMGILKRAIKSNGRMMSIRKLFQQIPVLLKRLCPCMLMSPISVAQYIDPSFPKFDLVIFDEASQLPTSEAVGTIARGENVVVVGDPKQLPPTNFFKSTHYDEENSEHEDLESLLDDCLAISMPQETLKWHYRSSHESLIAFSNMKYYDGELYTFPSPDDLVSEVKLVQLDGYYDKGKTRQNRSEAEAIVSEIIRRLSDEKLRNESIGVVTFNTNQQKLIMDMLIDAFNKYPQLEDFNNSLKEPIFIKNLESVQGDERDIILFSIGYGPDKNGKVSMNFGPLNRDGGWRRLNVAVSRARKRMIVYSVLRPEQIDLGSTASEGVAGLKGFLEYAKSGKTVVSRRSDIKLMHTDSVAIAIAQRLTKLGYSVRCNIGCSKFKVDIGIIDPTDSGRYLLGILIDGNNCKNSETARDRFVLQPNVLNRLNWNLMRVWVLDWIDDRDKVIEQIIAKINRAAEIPVEPAKSYDVIKPLPNNQIASYVVSEPVVKLAVAEYKTAKIPIQGNSESYYNPTMIENIKNAAEIILDAESPISKKLWMKRVTSLWGITRGGSRVDAIFTRAISRIPKQLYSESYNEFYWKQQEYKDVCDTYRVADESGNKRSMDDIPPQEILCAINEVLNEQVSLSCDDLVRETAKKFGYSRTGNVIETSIKYAIEKGVMLKIIQKMENGNITI